MQRAWSMIFLVIESYPSFMLTLDLLRLQPEADPPLAETTAYCHLITLSALTSTLGGIVKPICLAAFRLMMNSNFFGCSTGRSAGFAPFNIFSTYVAARRPPAAGVPAQA